MQKTLQKEVSLEGVGIHTGKKCKVRLMPVPAGSGVVFVRTDLPQQPSVKAGLDNLLSTNRRTSLASAEAVVQTVEHLLAPMFVLGVGNCRIEIDSEELPALDGSSLLYYNLLLDAGVRELDLPRRRFAVSAPVDVRSAEAFIRALPYEGFVVSYRLKYPQIGMKQEVQFAVNDETFAREIAPARSFCLEEEIEPLQAAGFGKGATEQNTVVLSRGGSRTKMRFSDEPARHKVLDVLGDMFFLDSAFKGRIECECSGHALNRKLVEALKESHPG